MLYLVYISVWFVVILLIKPIDMCVHVWERKDFWC